MGLLFALAAVGTKNAIKFETRKSEEIARSKLKKSSEEEREGDGIVTKQKKTTGTRLSALNCTHNELSNCAVCAPPNLIYNICNVRQAHGMIEAGCRLKFSLIFLKK